MTDIAPEASSVGPDSTSSSRSESSLRVIRQYGAFNGLGLWTLYKREVGRFLKVWMQTVFAPVVTTLLFMTVFKLASATAAA